jgi:ABC-type nitrate/sulfonate/bicarbonate transport system ATPase subunit
MAGMIHFDAVTFFYPHGAPVFENFSWQAQRAERWAVIGPSGCGKSTLLSLLAGLFSPNSGQIQIEGQTLSRPRPRSGLIIQEFGLLPWATVRQNATLGLQVRQFYGPDGTHAPAAVPPDGEDVDTWLERLGLSALAGRYPAQISGGQRQRTALARTLVLQPDLLLMDEPFSALDAPTRESLQTLTLDLCSEQNLTLVMVTHAIEEAAVLGEKILLLSQPPNRNAVVIDNPGARQKSYRETAEYQSVCRQLRQRLGVE